MAGRVEDPADRSAESGLGGSLARYFKLTLGAMDSGPAPRGASRNDEWEQKTPASLPGLCVVVIALNGMISNLFLPRRRPVACHHSCSQRPSSTFRPPYLFSCTVMPR